MILKLHCTVLDWHGRNKNPRLSFLWHFCNAFDLNMTWGDFGLPIISENVSENHGVATCLSWVFHSFTPIYLILVL